MKMIVHSRIAGLTKLILLATLSICISHIASIHSGVHFPLIAYGIMTGIGGGLAIWVCLGRGLWAARFVVSVSTVVVLAAIAALVWNSLPKWNARPMFPNSVLSAVTAMRHGFWWYLLIWAPLQVTVFWFGWRVKNSEANERDARVVRMRTLMVVASVLTTALVLVRLHENGVRFVSRLPILQYGGLMSLAAVYGCTFTLLVWGSLGARRLRVSILACLPYVCLLSSIWWYFWLSFGWIGNLVLVSHAVILIGTLLYMRSHGWRIEPYSRLELE